MGLLDEPRERRDVSSHLEEIGMAPGISEAQIKSLSGGNQQKIVMSRWLRHGVNVFLMDEPVQGIDIGAKQVIFDLVRTAAQGGAAVVMCSAVDEDLAALCNRVVVFSHGAIIAEFEAPDVSVTRIAEASHAIKTDKHDWTS